MNTKCMLLNLVLTSTLLGCGSDDISVEGSAEELTDVASAESLLVAATAPGEATDAEAAAAAAAAAFEEAMGACATSDVRGASVTWTLVSCSGASGLATLDGTVTATYRPVSGALEATLVLDITTETGARLHGEADVEYTTAGDSSVLAVSSEIDGAGRRGNETARSGAYTIETDGSCITVDGSWEGSALSWTLVAESFHACRGACPIGTFHRMGRSASTLRFDGSATAILDVEGDTSEIPLRCGS